MPRAVRQCHQAQLLTIFLFATMISFSTLPGYGNIEKPHGRSPIPPFDQHTCSKARLHLSLLYSRIHNPAFRTLKSMHCRARVLSLSPSSTTSRFCYPALEHVRGDNSYRVAVIISAKRISSMAWHTLNLDLDFLGRSIKQKGSKLEVSTRRAGSNLDMDRTAYLFDFLLLGRLSKAS